MGGGEEMDMEKRSRGTEMGRGQKGGKKVNSGAFQPGIFSPRFQVFRIFHAFQATKQTCCIF
jgi:hypothetical protein